MTTNIDRAAKILYDHGVGDGDAGYYYAHRLADAGLLASEYNAERQRAAEAWHVLNEVLHAKAKGRKTVRIDDLLGGTDE